MSEQSDRAAGFGPMGSNFTLHGRTLAPALSSGTTALDFEERRDSGLSKSGCGRCETQAPLNTGRTLVVDRISSAPFQALLQGDYRKSRSSEPLQEREESGIRWAASAGTSAAASLSCRAPLARSSTAFAKLLGHEGEGVVGVLADRGLHRVQAQGSGRHVAAEVHAHLLVPWVLAEVQPDVRVRLAATAAARLVDDATLPRSRAAICVSGVARSSRDRSALSCSSSCCAFREPGLQGGLLLLRADRSSTRFARNCTKPRRPRRSSGPPRQVLRDDRALRAPDRIEIVKLGLRRPRGQVASSAAGFS